MAADNHLIHALRAASKARGDAPFATDAGGTVTTLGAFWEGADRAAAALVAMGVAPGDRVAVLAEKSVAALQVYLGTLMAGAVHLPLNTGYSVAEVGYFLSDATPRVLICDPARCGALTGVAAGVDRVLTLDADGGGSFADAVRQAEPIAAAVPRGSDDIAAFLYTSGTTGRSKGAMLTHGNLVSNARALRDLWAFTEHDVLIHALPIFHTHGLFVAVNVTLVAGGALLLHRQFDAAAVLADFPRATSLMGVPTVYTRLLAEPALTRAVAGPMRLFVSGSAPMLTDTHLKWQARTGHTILERYGMTETTMITSNPYDGVRKPGTVGLPLPGVEVRVTGPEGAILSPGQVGGVEMRGPNLFAGYWNMPEKTAEDMRPDGWFRTGDLGEIDAEGYLTIVGRSKDVVISGGFNIYPREIELLVDAIDGVAESAAFGVPDPDLGERVVLAVVREAGSTMTTAQIMEASSAALARYKQIRAVHLMDALPRNTMGKVQKAELRRMFG